MKKLLLATLFTISVMSVSAQAFAAPTAKCRDGSYSYSAHHRGTCSHHGGVAEWL